MLLDDTISYHIMLKEAKIKKHSTFTEAIECSKKAKAKFTILTHFSQRYAKFPIFDEFEKDDNIGWAWDFMTVCPKTLKYFKPFYLSVNERFPEDLNEMLAKKDEYLQRNEGTPEDRISAQIGLDDDKKKPRNDRKRKTTPDTNISEYL